MKLKCVKIHLRESEASVSSNSSLCNNWRGCCFWGWGQGEGSILATAIDFKCIRPKGAGHAQPWSAVRYIYHMRMLFSSALRIWMQLLTLLGLLLSMTLLRVWAFEYLYGHTEKNINNHFLLLFKKIKISTFSQFFVKICGCWCINILYGIKKTFFFNWITKIRLTDNKNDYY